MTEWQVLLVIGEVVGLFLLVGKPIIKLNQTLTSILTRLNAVDQQQEAQRKAVERLDSRNSEAHKEIYEHLEEHDLMLENHKLRIDRLENGE